MQLVVQDAAKGDAQRPFAGLERAFETQARALVGGLQCRLAGDDDAAALGADLVDLELSALSTISAVAVTTRTDTFSSPAKVNARRSGVRLIS
jgi:hypothetical protein